MQFPDPPSTLDADTAEELLAFFDRFPVLKVAGFSLWTFEEMTPEAAKVVARSGSRGDDAHDAGMIEIGRHLSFAPESLQRIVILGEPGGQHLDGDFSVRVKLPGLVDLAHAAAAQEANDLEIVQTCARLQHGLSSWDKGRAYVCHAKRSVRSRQSTFFFSPDFLSRRCVR